MLGWAGMGWVGSNFARKLPLFAFPIIWNNWSPKLPFTVSEACMKKLIKRSLIYSYAEPINAKILVAGIAIYKYEFCLS